jgi:hypothetical protein
MRDTQGRQNIEAGNIAAHDGDAITDASLFTSGVTMEYLQFPHPFPLKDHANDLG